MTVQDGFDRFIRVKKAKNLSPETIEHYQIDFRYFSGFFDVSMKCDTITLDTYYSYIEYLQQTRKANSYVEYIFRVA